MTQQIELGEYGGATPAETPEDGGQGPDTRRRRRTDPGRRARRRRLVQRSVAFLVALLCLLGLSASTRVEPGLTRPLWMVPQVVMGFGLSTNSLFLVEAGGDQLTARDLETGEFRWQIRPADAATSVVDLGHGVVRVDTHARPSDGLQSSSGIMLVSEATGKVLLESRGLRPAITIGDRLVLLRSTQVEISTECGDEPTVCVDLVAFDLASRAEVWRISVPEDSALVHLGMPGPRFAIEVTSGPVVVRDVATGAVTDTLRPGSRDDGTVAQSAALAGDILVTAVRGSTGGEARIIGYRLDPLRQVWSAALPVGPVTDFTEDFAFMGCGPLLCLRIDGGSTIVDPESGRMGPHLRVDVVDQLGGGDLIAVHQLRQRSAVYRLDPTGIARDAFTNATVVDWPDANGRVLLKHEGEARKAFTIVDRDGRTTSLGSIEATSLICTARRAILVCYGSGGQLLAWRLPS